MYSSDANLWLNVSKRSERLDDESFQTLHRNGDCVLFFPKGCDLKKTEQKGGVESEDAPENVVRIGENTSITQS